MKILVLGHSGSEGGQLADPTQAWRYTLPGRLKEKTGLDVELVHEKVYVHVAGSADRAEKLVAKHEPDIVIIPLTTHAFTVQFVNTKIRNKLGQKAAGYWDRATTTLDARTRHRGTLFKRVNTLSRIAAYKVIGSAPTVTYAEGLELYREILRRLARQEHIEVLLLGAAPHAGAPRRENKNEARIVDRFHRDIKSDCDRLHYVFVDKIEAFKAGGYDSKFYPDGIHNNDIGHQAMADVLLAAFDDEGHVRHD